MLYDHFLNKSICSPSPFDLVWRRSLCKYDCYRKRRRLPGLWIPDMACCCCICIVLGVIASVIVLSLIPLYLSSRQIGQSYSGIFYSLSIYFHLYTHNWSPFRHSHYHCILRYKSDEYKFIHNRISNYNSYQCKCFSVSRICNSFFLYL
jgi:hypothetical protein